MYNESHEQWFISILEYMEIIRWSFIGDSGYYIIHNLEISLIVYFMELTIFS